jgi:hypothetical protein
MQLLQKSKVLLCVAMMAFPIISHAAFPIREKEQTQEAIAASNASTTSTSLSEAATDASVVSASAATVTEHKDVVKTKSSFFKRLLHGGGGNRSQVAAILLCLFLGDLGIHRFYLGYTWQGIVQLLTLGGFGVWALIDLIRIIIGSLQPKNGSYN